MQFRNPKAVVTWCLYNEAAIHGVRVSKSHRSEWTSCLTYLEYSSTVTRSTNNVPKPRKCHKET